ncbi:TonB-dependent receptor plug domain-containing protein [Catenovulum maritimum]|uniref:TonB-dependent receptor plug domain-containing protein n=1 Tax=Catenovulum maritimum TaxID=1513271 RepID=UPI00069D9CE2|nr:TonB-dependent receptor [Catenovulum maritimum]
MINKKLITIAIMLALTPYVQAETYDESLATTDDFFDDFYGSEEMVEIATGVKTQIYKAPAVASVFSAEQIKSMGATDIDDVLETVPGLHISRRPGGYNPIYSFRGVYEFNNAQALMLINGIPITNAYIGNRNQNWGGMPVEAIARIEVIRGPGSAVYGADAFAGVINIVTKSAKDIKQSEVAFRAGAKDTQDAWLITGGEVGDVSYSAIIEYHKTNGSDKVVEADRQTLNDLAHGTTVSHAPGAINRYAENIDFRGELNWQEFTLRAGLQKRRRGIGAGLIEALDPTSLQGSKRYNLDLTYKTQLTDELNFQAQASFFKTSQEVIRSYILFPAGFAGVYPDGFIGNPEVFEKHKRINFTSLYTGLSKHQIRVGMGYHNADLYKTRETKNFSLGPDGAPILPGSPLQDVSDTDYIFLKERDRDNQYIFIQDVWTIANDWELTAGLRYDNYSDFGSTTNPRLALVWSTSLNLSTKFLYGKAFRAPSFGDTSLINNPAQLGNPNVKPETIETTELAFDYHPRDGFGAIVNFYHYTWDDILQVRPDPPVEGAPATKTMQNFGQQSAYGTEIELNWQLHDNFKTAVNYAWSNAENETNNTEVAYVPRHQWFVQFDLKINNQLTANFKNNFVQNRQRNKEDVRGKVDDYWLADLSLRWKPKADNIEASLIVKNLFDEDAREPSPDAAGLVYMPNDLPLPGRAVYGELRYSF